MFESYFIIRLLRLLAFLIDFGISCVYTFILFGLTTNATGGVLNYKFTSAVGVILAQFVVGFFSLFSQYNNKASSFQFSEEYIVAITIILIFSLYSSITEYYLKFTFGKFICGLRVIKMGNYFSCFSRHVLKFFIPLNVFSYFFKKSFSDNITNIVVDIK